MRPGGIVVPADRESTACNEVYSQLLVFDPQHSASNLPRLGPYEGRTSRNGATLPVADIHPWLMERLTVATIALRLSRLSSSPQGIERYFLASQ